MARQAVKMVGVAIGSFILGAVVVGGPIVWWESVTFKNDYYTKIAEVANIAHHIRGGRQQELLRTCEENLRQCVPIADRFWGDDEARLPVFRSVEYYYRKYKLEVPAELKPILDRLPPKPPCDMKRDLKAASQPGARTSGP